MSDSVPSSETPVAPAETNSAPSEAVQPTAKENVAPPAAAFGSGRGSGLARGKRGSSPAAATQKNAPSGDYKPTAIQVVSVEREYKNPFAPEQPAAPAQPTAPVAPVTAELPVSAPVSNTPAQTPAPVETRTPVSATPAAAPATSALPEEKSELKILPPEDRPRPAQSWESSSFPGKTNSDESRPQGRREDRPTFRVDRRENRGADSRPADARPSDARPSDSQGGEPRRQDRGNDFRRHDRNDRGGEPRREGRGDFRDNRPNREGGERREPRSFEPRPAPTPPPAAPAEKQGGFFGWLKGLFSGDAAETEAVKPAEQTRPDQQGDRRHDGGQRHRHHRGGGGGGRGGYRGDFRGGENRGGENRGPREGGQGGGENAGGGDFGGERRFEGGGGRRRRHRGGRGRGGYGGENRGGDSRPENGGGPSDT